ncbi:hypothetical protein CHU92_13800 [Flavobacterium cyanobacteriorum]|uniref:Short-chain dehydrogenase n=1 Tax=Flavobacterium cyanobacteriorum TaxID=2022802 RepID=A0A255YUZ3_9FLAO|nr:SDR family oxidoreductase [Flavobacterium cyanobacteriorum]OYQ32991.1 hypothetical protein CHU92_13800 [Flavobacterium cyanobacteriorum]
MKVALITGANKGIGLEVARQLGQHGVKILIGARNTEKGEKASGSLRAIGVEAGFIHLDVTREESIIAAARQIREEYGKLDILVNNAGVFPEYFQGLFDVTVVPQEVLAATFQTNVFGAILTIKHLLPLLKKAPYANIVNVASTAGSITDQSDPASPFYSMRAIAYASSKAALNMVTVQVAKQLAGTDVKINSICPGWVRTDMGTEHAPRTVAQGASIIVKMASLAKEDTTNGAFVDDLGIIPW